MKMYVVLWCGSYDVKWICDGVFMDKGIAEAKLSYERLAHPTWRHALVEIDAPPINGETEEKEQA